MPLLDEYLAVRRAAGFKLAATECRLRRFVAFAAEREEQHIRVDTAVAWAGEACSPHERHVRLCDVVIFARHLRAEDPKHELPSSGAFAFKRHKRLPYIYSDDDIREILRIAGQRHRKPGDSIGDTLATFFGLIATTGLRVCEAINLQLRDVTDAGLLVRNTKFRKSRLVPLHPTTMAALTTFRATWRGGAPAEAPLFACRAGTRLNYGHTHKVFNQITEQMGLRKPAAERHRMPGPRIHDLRHTFAVRALESCPTGRAEINKHMLALTTYLGHASVANTFWYLHATPQLMGDIADACEAWLVGGDR